MSQDSRERFGATPLPGFKAQVTRGSSPMKFNRSRWIIMVGSLVLLGPQCNFRGELFNCKGSGFGFSRDIVAYSVPNNMFYRDLWLKKWNLVMKSFHVSTFFMQDKHRNGWVSFRSVQHLLRRCNLVGEMEMGTQEIFRKSRLVK